MKVSNSLFIKTIFLLVGISSSNLSVAEEASRAPQSTYTYYDIGNKNAASAPKTEAAMMLMGGGEWVPAAFSWWLEKAGNGRIVVLRASGNDELQNELFNDIGGVKSVQTIVFHSREAANDPKVLAIVKAADGIFLAGGDQSNYIRYWKGTLLNQALNQHVQNGKPIAGTSAGLAILGAHSYGAMDGGSINSQTAMENPLGDAVTLDSGFLAMPYLENILTDSHFAERNRLGRLITFIARAEYEQKTSGIVGLGIDEETALCIDANGSSRVFSNKGGFAWMVAKPKQSLSLNAEQALNVESIPVIGIGENSRLQFPQMEVENPVFHADANIQNGKLKLRYQPKYK